MQVILDIKYEYLPIDSVGDIGLTEDIAEIAEGSSAISAAARKILEMFYGYQYVREAERWEETSMVVHNNDTTKTNLNSSITKENKEILENGKNLKPDFILIPNPSDGNFEVKLNSSAKGFVSIIDMHGKIINEIEIAKNGILKIEKGSLTPGVYNIRLINSADFYQLNKRIIILE